jgi:hypothetical protein
MCVYCFFADYIHRWYYPSIPPGQPWPRTPVQPWPVNPIQPLPTAPYPQQHPWTREQLDETMELIRQIKEMEDALGGCPCEEPSKLDFLKEIRDRLDALEAAQKGSPDDDTTEDTTSGPHPISE